MTIHEARQTLGVSENASWEEVMKIDRKSQAFHTPRVLFGISGTFLLALLIQFLIALSSPDCTLGICTFMLGMNMGVAQQLFDCKLPKALLGAGVCFIVAPACMAVISFAVGLRGNMFRFAVMQAMVPQAIISFVYANHSTFILTSSALRTFSLLSFSCEQIMTTRASIA
ncbi:unnamed protein product [Calypogeia fissa]